MSRITGVVVALATAATVMTGSTAGAEPAAQAAPPTPVARAATAADLPREIPGGVELTLADGDLLRVWAARSYRVVWASRRDAATGAWSARREVLREKDLYCGNVDARTANGAVAVTAMCDRYGYAEDQAPTHSRAIWSPDTVTWSSYRLDGESYDEPGISPDGISAVWPQGGGYVTRTAAGFSEHRLDTAGQEYTATATIADTGQVSYLYGAQLGNRCRLVVQTRTGDAEPTRQELRIANGCSDSNFANVDADTTVYGDFTNPAYQTVISRPDASSPWAVTQVAPAFAPGLQGQDGGLYADFFTMPGTLVAVSSPDRSRILTQVYDPTAQAWQPPVTTYDAGARRCRWGDHWAAEPLAVLVVDLRCGGRHVVLTSRDGTAWQALRMGHHVYGLSPDAQYVAVPGRSRTYVLSAERGVVTLPMGVTGRCDVVVPDGPDGAVLLTAAGRNRGWPTVLQHSSAGGWERLSRTRLRTYDRPCRRVQQDFYEPPYGFSMIGRLRGYGVRVLERGGEWKALRIRY